MSFSSVARRRYFFVPVALGSLNVRSELFTAGAVVDYRIYGNHVACVLSRDVLTLELNGRRNCPLLCARTFADFDSVSICSLFSWSVCVLKARFVPRACRSVNELIAQVIHDGERVSVIDVIGVTHNRCEFAVVRNAAGADCGSLFCLVFDGERCLTGLRAILSGRRREKDRFQLC